MRRSLHPYNVLELELMADHGIPMRQVLIAATSGNAQTVGIEGRVGRRLPFGTG